MAPAAAAASLPEAAAAASYSGRLKRGGCSSAPTLAPEEARVRAVAEVVNALIAGVKEGRDVDLNQLKTEVRGAACGAGCCWAAGLLRLVLLLAMDAGRQLVPCRLEQQLPLAMRASQPCSCCDRDRRCRPLGTQVSRKYALARAPKLVEMIAAVPEEHRATLLPQLRAKPVRTASGIAVVAVMSKPHRCPHIATTGGRSCGLRQPAAAACMRMSHCRVCRACKQQTCTPHNTYRHACTRACCLASRIPHPRQHTGNICVYCPGGPDSDFEYSTQSYTGYEPTSMRAIRARYNPYVQASGRRHVHCAPHARRSSRRSQRKPCVAAAACWQSTTTATRAHALAHTHTACPRCARRRARAWSSC